MTRDYSQFLKSTTKGGGAKHKLTTLETLGWQPYFAQQTSVDEMADTPPVRIIEVHRTGLHAVGDEVDTVIPPGPDATVGDWLMFDRAHPPSSRVLDRKSLILSLIHI